MDAIEHAYAALLRASPNREPTTDELMATTLGVFPRDVIEARANNIAGQRVILRRMLQDPGIEQRTPAWYAARDELLTASDLGQALNRGKFGNRAQLLVRKVTRVPMKDPAPGEFNPFKHGKVYESVALQLYQQYLRGSEPPAEGEGVGEGDGENVAKPKPKSTPLLPVHEFGLLRHPTLRCFGASPDGVTELGIMVEIKCPIRRKITGDIPDQYWVQMQGQMEVADLNGCDFVEVDVDTEAYMDISDMVADVTTPWEQKGVVVSDDADEKYEYSPPGADDAGLRAWLTGVGIDPRFVITNKRVRMWRQRKILVQRVLRDRDFWTATSPLISAFWADVQAGREALASPDGWNPDDGTSKKKRATSVRRKKNEGGASNAFPAAMFQLS